MLLNESNFTLVIEFFVFVPLDLMFTLARSKGNQDLVFSPVKNLLHRKVKIRNGKFIVVLYVGTLFTGA